VWPLEPISPSNCSSLKAENRIGRVAYEPELGVETWWDLGIGDSTAIWFTQSTGREIRIIDYYEASGEGLLIMRRSSKKGLMYTASTMRRMILRLGSWVLAVVGKETAQSLGIVFQVVPNLSIEEVSRRRGRSLHVLVRFVDSRKRASRGLNALSSYHKAYDDKLESWKFLSSSRLCLPSCRRL